MQAKITGIGRFVPDKRITNADLEQLVDTNDEWIVSRTGIRERRILAPDTGTSHMAVRAAEAALAMAGADAGSIDLIVCATVTPDMPVPSMVSFVQKELGASRAWGFDVNGGCAGFLCALVSGAQFIEAGRHRRVLVIGADKMSAITDFTDRNTCILFGDGAGAVLLEPTEEAGIGILDFSMRVDGEGIEFLTVVGGGSLFPATAETVANKMHYVRQEGKTVFKFAVTGMTQISREVIERCGLTGDEIDLLIPHQANRRIIDAVSEKLSLPPEKVMINIDKYGNTTAATIPMAMAEAFEEGRLKKQDRVLLSAFGAGFTWGGVLLGWALDPPSSG